MSTHGHGAVAQLFLGSVATGVVSGSPCPVLCIKCADSGMLHGNDVRLDRVLVPIDLSAESRLALGLAVGLAKKYHSQLHLMYVVHVDVPAELLGEEATPSFQINENLYSHITRRIQEFQSEVDSGIEQLVTTIEKGSPAKRIADYAASQAIDLIIISRKGLGKTPHGLGCVIGRLLHEEHTPMLVI